jgi:hypothetical protein
MWCGDLSFAGAAGFEKFSERDFPSVTSFNNADRTPNHSRRARHEKPLTSRAVLWFLPDFKSWERG